MKQDLRKWTLSKIDTLDYRQTIAESSDKQLEELQMGLQQYFPDRYQLVQRINRIKKIRQFTLLRQNQQRKQYNKRHLRGPLCYLLLYWYIQLVAIFVFFDFSSLIPKSQCQMRQQLLAFQMCAFTLLNVVIQSIRQNIQNSEQIYLMFLWKKPNFSLKKYVMTQKLIPLILQSAQLGFSVYFIFQMLSIGVEISAGSLAGQRQLWNQLILLPFLWIGSIFPFVRNR